MKTGYQGTFVMSWAQTEVDGLENAPISALGVGASWRWTGTPLRIDGPSQLLVLAKKSGETDLRRRAAHVVQKLVGVAQDPSSALGAVPVNDPALNVGFELTDGHVSFMASVVEVKNGHNLIVFVGDTPPADTDLWVVRSYMQPGQVNRLVDQPTGVICFTSGTRIRTPNGETPVEQLAVGDVVQTRDNGARKVLWIGHRRISGARLFAMPELRPVRLRAGALGSGQPDSDLVVSPKHQILVSGKHAQALFNEDEVLVSARDLVDERRVIIDRFAMEVVYYHLLLDDHQVVWANGVLAESFHPANADLGTVDPAQRAQLLDVYPELELDPMAYGAFARRRLSAGEAAILRGDVA